LFAEALRVKAKMTGADAPVVLYQTLTVYEWPFVAPGEQLLLKALRSLRSPFVRLVTSSFSAELPL